MNYVMRRGRRIEVETIHPDTAPTKKRHKTSEPFVKVPLWWIAAAAKATRSPATVVCVELLHASWKAKSPTFPLPNGKLQRLGVTRETKRRVLRSLEQEGLVRVVRLPRKTPIVTLISL
jgi:hypothetical protein